MQFFLYEVVARIVAIALCFFSGRRLRSGFVERKISYLNEDILDPVDWSKVIAHRDATPVRYWILIGIEISTLAAGLVMAIFGWWVPNT